MDPPCLGCGGTSDVPQFAMAPASLPEVTGGQIPYVDSRIAFTVVAGSVVLHDRVRGRSHALNASAAQIWSMIDDEITVAALVEQLAAAQGLAPEVIADDVHEALARFAFNGVIGLAATRDEVGELARTSELLDEGSNAKSTIDAEAFGDIEWLPSSGPLRVGATTVEVRTNAVAVSDQLSVFVACLPDVPDAEVELQVLDLGPAEDLRYRVFVGPDELQAATTLEVAVALAEFELNRLAITRAPGALVLHGAAGERDGRAIAVVGPSGHGKSTLCAALVRAGFAYLTDEVVILDPRTRRVQPYPKSLDLHADAAELLGIDHGPTNAANLKVRPDELGELSDGGELAAIVVLASPDGAGMDVVVLDPVDALLGVLSNAFAESMDFASALDELGSVCTTTRVIRLPRMEIALAVDVVERTLA